MNFYIVCSVLGKWDVTDLTSYRDTDDNFAINIRSTAAPPLIVDIRILMPTIAPHKVIKITNIEVNPIYE